MKKVLLIICFAISFVSLFGQMSEKEWRSECDTITKNQFIKLIKVHNRKMKNNFNFNVDQMVKLVRIYNTLHFLKYYDSLNIRKNNFRKLFDERYVDKAIAILECKPMQGNWYSEKYHLYITSGYRMRCDNYFILR